MCIATSNLFGGQAVISQRNERRYGVKKHTRQKLGIWYGESDTGIPSLVQSNVAPRKVIDEKRFFSTEFTSWRNIADPIIKTILSVSFINNVAVIVPHQAYQNDQGWEKSKHKLCASCVFYHLSMSACKTVLSGQRAHFRVALPKHAPSVW